MRISRVDLKLKLMPNEEKLHASAFLTIKNPKKTIELLINKQIKLIEMSSEVGGKKYCFTPKEKEAPEDHFLKVVKIWSIKLPKELQNLEELLLSIEYKGTIESDPWGTNFISHNSVELGIYVAYYPLLDANDKITYSMMLQGPKDWDWIMNSDILKDSNSTIWFTKEPRIDIYLIGISQELSIQEKESKRFWGAEKNFHIFNNLSGELGIFEKGLKDWLGTPEQEKFKIVLSPRKSGGLISRQGLISMQDNLPEDVIQKNREALILSWTHEMGHFWFNSTTVQSYHNWVDEALCDYCALVLAFENYGEEFYQNRINKIKKIIRNEKELPAICEITRGHEKAEILYYKYGSLIFHELKNQIGLNAFKEAIKIFANRNKKVKVADTSLLIDSFNEITKMDWSQFFEEKLSNPPNID